MCLTYLLLFNLMQPTGPLKPVTEHVELSPTAAKRTTVQLLRESNQSLLLVP